MSMKLATGQFIEGLNAAILEAFHIKLFWRKFTGTFVS
jgi:hypothetical protein